jgi:hypothetical protein
MCVICIIRKFPALYYNISDSILYVDQIFCYHEVRQLQLQQRNIPPPIYTRIGPNR